MTYVHLEPTPVDESEDSDASVLLSVATSAADRYMLGPNGPMRNKMPPADSTRGTIRAGLLYLLELGLITPNTELTRGRFSHPAGRTEDR